MAWTVSIRKVVLRNGQPVVSAEISDGTRTFIDEFSAFTTKDLDTAITSYINRLDAVDAFIADMGSYVYSPPVVVEPPPPTKDEADFKAYLELRNKWDDIQMDIKVGLLEPDDPAVAAMELELKTAYKPEYSGL